MTDDAQERELRRFFQGRIVPAAEALRARNESFFALGADRGERSYWATRPGGEGYIFDIGDDLEGQLREMWRDHSDLQALARNLVAMTDELAQRREEPADVSSFIYAMF